MTDYEVYRTSDGPPFVRVTNANDYQSILGGDFTVRLRSDAVPVELQVTDNDNVFDDFTVQSWEPEHAPGSVGGTDGDQTLTKVGGVSYNNSIEQQASSEMSYSDGSRVTIRLLHTPGGSFPANQGSGSFYIYSGGRPPQPGEILYGGTGANLSSEITYSEVVICFCRGTMINTAQGEKAVEDLKPGDMVLTMDNGYQPLRLNLSRKVDAKTLANNSKLLPVTISAGALGNNIPEHDLQISRQHRMLISSAISERMFNAREVLVAAVNLTELPGVYFDINATEVEYFHLVFDDHQIVFANGAPSESFYPGEEGLKALTPQAYEELTTLFSQEQLNSVRSKVARPIPDSKKQKKLIDRHFKNTKPVIDITTIAARADTTSPLVALE